MNLCQEIHGGLTDCPDGAAVCRKRSSGKTETLGRVFTQSMGFAGQRPLSCTQIHTTLVGLGGKKKNLTPSSHSPDGKIQVNYSMGDAVCGNSKPAKTIVQLSCGSTVGHPKLLK